MAGKFVWAIYDPTNPNMIMIIIMITIKMMIMILLQTMGPVHFLLYTLIVGFASGHVSVFFCRKKPHQ